MALTPRKPRLRYVASSTTAVNALANQAAAGASMNLHESDSARTESTTAPNLGPTLGVDVINSDMLMIVEGYIIVTVSGDLELWHASGTAAASTVKAGTSLIVTKTSP